MPDMLKTGGLTKMGAMGKALGTGFYGKAPPMLQRAYSVQSMSSSEQQAGRAPIVLDRPPLVP